MNDQQTSKPRGTVTRKASVLVAALAIVGMGSMTVACSSHTDKPAETTSSSVAVTPTEKNAGCSGGAGSVGDGPGCAGKHHNNNGNNSGNHGKNNRHNGNGGGKSHTGGGNSHGGGGNSHKGGGGGRGHK